jgi:hypothetical protein
LEEQIKILTVLRQLGVVSFFGMSANLETPMRKYKAADISALLDGEFKVSQVPGWDKNMKTFKINVIVSEEDG